MTTEKTPDVIMSEVIFDFENEFIKTFHIINDIDLLYENVMENDISKDDIANVLLGLKKIYSMRFEKSFDLFEKLCKEYHQLNEHED
jgi:hypothetical protein